MIGARNTARVLAAIVPLVVRTALSGGRDELNGQPGAIFCDRVSKPLDIGAIDMLDGRIRAIGTVADPARLARMGLVTAGRAVARQANRVRPR